MDDNNKENEDNSPNPFDYFSLDEDENDLNVGQEQQRGNENQTPFTPPQQDTNLPSFSLDNFPLQNYPQVDNQFVFQQQQQQEQAVPQFPSPDQENLALYPGNFFDPYFYQQQDERENFGGQQHQWGNDGRQGQWGNGFYNQNEQGVLPDPNANLPHFEVPQNVEPNVEPNQHQNYVLPQNHTPPQNYMETPEEAERSKGKEKNRGAAEESRKKRLDQSYIMARFIDLTKNIPKEGFIPEVKDEIGGLIPASFGSHQKAFARKLKEDSNWGSETRKDMMEGARRIVSILKKHPETGDASKKMQEYLNKLKKANEKAPPKPGKRRGPKPKRRNGGNGGCNNEEEQEWEKKKDNDDDDENDPSTLQQSIGFQRCQHFFRQRSNRPY